MASLCSYTNMHVKDFSLLSPLGVGIGQVDEATLLPIFSMLVSKINH